MAESDDSLEPAGDAAGPRLTRTLWLSAMGALVFLSLWPVDRSKGVEIDRGWNVFWTLAHIPSYAVVVGLTVPLVYARLQETALALLLSALFGAVLGVFLELLQPLVGRTATVADVALNLLGVFLAIAFWTGGRVMSRRGPGFQGRRSN